MTRTCGHEIFTAMLKPVWKLPNKSEPITVRVRAHLVKTAKQGVLITYGNLADAVDISPPHRIHQLTEALEFLMEEDAAARRPFIAALAISKRRGGLPAPGFFDCARRLGRYTGKNHDASAFAYHAWESNAAHAFWTDSG